MEIKRFAKNVSLIASLYLLENPADFPLVRFCSLNKMLNVTYNQVNYITKKIVYYEIIHFEFYF
jgi:hypothetical protein